MSKIYIGGADNGLVAVEVIPIKNVYLSQGRVSSVFGRLGDILAIEADYQAFYPRLSQAYSNPTWISSLAWSKITGTPTTLSGYGITDAYTQTQINNFFSGSTSISGYNKSNWDTAFGWGNHANAGYLTVVNLGYTASTINGVITNTEGTNATIPLVSTNAGLMSPGDKTKLDGIAVNANNYSHPTQTALDSGTLTGAVVISRVAANTLGHLTNISTRTLTLADLGYTGATNADNYNSWNLRTGGVQRLAVTSGNFIDIVGGSNVTVGYASNVITISSIDTNTTYTAGAGLTLTGTTFSLTGQALALHNLASNGLIAITGAGSVASITIIGSSSISVTNGNGVSGNPTLSAIFGTTVGTVAEGNDSRFHNPVTIGTANGLSLSIQVLSLGLASTSTNGALSSTDWNNFNTAFGWGNHASAGYTSNTGTVTSVTGGTGLSGTVTTSGSINAVIAGAGLTLMPSRGRQVNGADMNTWLDSGVYGMDNSVTNGPSVTSFDPVLVLRNIDVGAQLKIPRFTGGNMEYRGWSLSGSSWTSWITVWDSNNFNPSTKADTGGGNATGTWGINITGNSNTATTLQTARTINGTSFNGSANITTANWGTVRTLTIGSTGKSVNGSANVSWSLAEIGAQPAGSYALTSTSILAGNGLTGGGTLATDRTLSVVFGTTAGTVAQGNDSRIINGQTAFGWGNHAGLYALASHTHSIAQVTGLQAALDNTVDSNGSYFGTGNLVITNPTIWTSIYQLPYGYFTSKYAVGKVTIHRIRGSVSIVGSSFPSFSFITESANDGAVNFSGIASGTYGLEIEVITTIRTATVLKINLVVKLFTATNVFYRSSTFERGVSDMSTTLLSSHVASIFSASNSSNNVSVSSLIVTEHRVGYSDNYMN